VCYVARRASLSSRSERAVSQLAVATFGGLLRRHRLSAGLTQEALADRAGLSVHAVQNLERGSSRPYRDTVRRLAEALRLPREEASALFDAAPPAPRHRASRGNTSPTDLRHNLPAPLTTFIGRELEKQELPRLLTSARLLTLTGVGGCGKTRLALEIGRLVYDTYRDGVWLVELAAISDPALVAHSVAAVVRVSEVAGQSTTDALASRLQTRRMVLVLDNCEHLLETCAHLVDMLLRACPELRVLATSREALGLSGEVAWRVPSLPVPDLGHVPALPELGQNASVQLFTERAVSCQPNFLLDESNARSVAQVCARLDGIPLALELAAARVAVLTVDQIAARLDRCFRLLTGGSRAALPRQQTLRATLDWSYELLTEAERVLFNRLAVFAGGWSLEAAELVCADQRSPQGDVLGVLIQLVSKSLVLADDSVRGAKRYRLLETVRQYGRERLLAAGEAETLHKRHASFFLLLGDLLQLDLQYSNGYVHATRQQLDELEREQDNLRAALRWWIEADDAERAVKQACNLFQVWFRGSVTEGQLWLQEILGMPSAIDNPAVRRGALPMLANLACRHADYLVAQDAFDELLAAQRSAGDRLGAAYTLGHLANVHYLRAAYTDAWACLDASRAEATDIHDEQFENFWRNYASMLALCEGRYELARSLASAALIGFASFENPVPRAYCQKTLGTVEREEGRYSEANARFLEALDVALEFGDRTLLAHLLEGFSGLASAVGQHERAVRLGGAAAALRETAGAPISPAWQAIGERWLAISREALGEDATSAAWAEGRTARLERIFDEATQIDSGVAWDRRRPTGQPEVRYR
jgi:predicted ATPase/DNA-binding XRE family transcriptional regulator